MTHSWFQAIIELPSTYFVKALAILRFWPNFQEIIIFDETPQKTGENKFSPILQFFLKIYPFLDSSEVTSALKYGRIIIFLEPSNLSILSYPVIQICLNTEKLKFPPFREKCEFLDSVKSVVVKITQIFRYEIFRKIHDPPQTPYGLKFFKF